MTPHYFLKHFKITNPKNQPKRVVLACAFFLIISPVFASAQPAVPKTNQVAEKVTKVLAAKKINTTTVELLLSDNQRLTLDFYGDHIFRLFEDPTGGFIRDPEAKPEAKI
jgi:glutamate racemase